MHDTKELARNAPGMTLQDGQEMVDMVAMRAYRLARVQAQIEANDCAAAVLIGPINIRYATGCGRGQIFNMHCPLQIAVVPRDGQVILFEGFREGDAAGWLPETVAERRGGLAFSYFPVGEKNLERSASWARQVADMVREIGAGQRIAVDVCDPLGIHALEAEGLEVIAGELVAFDCGLIGPFGYSADVSRTFLCKPGRPTSEQKRLYGLAYENIQRNLDLVKAGMSFRELSERSWMPPEEFHAHRYPMSMHGIGMGDEWPSIPWPMDWEKAGYDGALEENMVICVESFIGSEHGGEGVKLEEQVVVTRDGYQQMSTFPFEDELLD